MNSSREWGDDLNRISFKGDPELRRRVVRGAMVLLTVVLVAGLALASWYFLRSRCQPLLVEARLLVQKAMESPPEHAAELQTAASLSREYLRRGGPDEDAAELLLCVALTLRGTYDVDQPTSEELEIEELMNKINPSVCTTEDLMTAIDVFIYNGQLAQADWLMGAAVENSKGSGDHQRVLRLAADLRYDLGREEKVLEHCRELSAIDPKDPEPWRLTAMVHEDGGYDERMIEALKEVIDLNQDDTTQDRLRLIRSLITIGDRTQARAQFAVLESEAPDLIARDPLIKARLLMLEGETQEATTIIDRVLADDPQASEAMLLKSQLLLSQNELDEAIQLLVRLLVAEPMNFQAHYTVGQAYARDGQRERAQHHLAMHKRILDTRVRIHSLERRAGRNARDTEARTELIQLYEELGMTEHADFWRRTTASMGGS